MRRRLPQQLFHLFAKISAFYAEGLVIHLNIRIAGNAEHGLFKYIVHFKHMVSVGEQNILGENIARRVVSGRNTTGGSDAGYGQKTEPFGLFVAEQRGNMPHLALKVREWMVRVHNLRRENRRNDILEIPLDVFLFVRRKRIHCQSAQTNRTQFAVHIGERRVTTCIERLNRLVDQMQLLFGGQTGFAVGMLLVHAAMSHRLPTRIMKNSSRLLVKIARNLKRSSRGTFSSSASASTRALNCSHESSRVLGVALLPIFCVISYPPSCWHMPSFYSYYYTALFVKEQCVSCKMYKSFFRPQVLREMKSSVILDIK